MFKNKEMPGLGVLTLFHNILAIKFSEDLSDTIKLLPQKLSQTKKHMNLNSEIYQSENNFNHALTNLPNVTQNMTKLRPKT